MPKYKRILLKLSGEALLGEQAYGVDPNVIEAVALEVKEVSALGVEVALVIGGGNIFRGVAASAKGMERTTADYVGMLATVMNSLALQDALREERRYDPRTFRHRDEGTCRAVYQKARGEAS